MKVYGTAVSCYLNFLVDQAELVKIRIFSDDCEAVIFGELPDGEIISLIKTNKLDLR